MTNRLMTGSAVGIDLALWAAATEADPEFALCARWTDVAVQIRVDDAVLGFRIAESRIVPDHEAQSYRIVMKSSWAAWRDFLAQVPEAPNHSILGMDRRRDDFSIVEGRDLLVRNLRALTLALAMMRKAVRPEGVDQ